MLLLLSACGGGRKRDPASELPVRRPLAVIAEAEIAGTILGQKLRAPSGLAVDGKGNLYVSDGGNNRIIKFDPDLVPLQDVGGYGNQPGLFDQPGFIVVDNNLNLLVGDAGNQRLCRYDSRLNYVDEISLLDDEDLLKYGYCSGIAVTDYGEVWMADRQNNRVVVFDNVGRFDRFVGEFGYSGGQLSSPEKIVYDGRSQFIVCDAGNSRVMVYDEYGNFSRRITSDALAYPIALAIDRQRHYWVVDSEKGRLAFLSPKGQSLFESNPMPPGTSTPLKNPSDIVILSQDRIAVADTGNNRILILRVILEEP